MVGYHLGTHFIMLKRKLRYGSSKTENVSAKSPCILYRQWGSAGEQGNTVIRARKRVVCSGLLSGKYFQHETFRRGTQRGTHMVSKKVNDFKRKWRKCMGIEPPGEFKN